jgi:hypothetical protein
MPPPRAVLLDPFDGSSSEPGAGDSSSTPYHLHGHAILTLQMGPHALTRELRDQRVKDARALLEVLHQQDKAHFRDITC